MEVFKTMVNLQLMLFLLIAAGFFLARRGIMTDAARKGLTNLLIDLILPCNIIHSFLGGISVSAEFVKNCLLAVLISLGIQLFATFASRPLFARFPKQQSSVLSYGMICSNSSFIGLPVAEALYGELGVLYTSLFQIPIRFTMWTAGLALFTSVSKKDALRRLIKHPCIVSIFIGIALMLLPFELPAFLSDTLTAVSRCNVPVSMLVIGAILSQADARTMLSRPVLYYTLLRLVAFPLLVYAVLRALPLDPLLVKLSVLMTGMPAGSTTSILADQYGCDAAFAGKLVFVSTLASIVTIPLLTLALG